MNEASDAIGQSQMTDEEHAAFRRERRDFADGGNLPENPLDTAEGRLTCAVRIRAAIECGEISAQKGRRALAKLGHLRTD